MRFGIVIMVLLCWFGLVALFCCDTMDSLLSWVALCLVVVAGGFEFLEFLRFE